jgi:hypothetical protein
MTKRNTDDYWVQQLADLKAEVRALKGAAVRFAELPVTAVDPATSTFTVDIIGPDGEIQQLSGLDSGSQLMPEVGDVARIATAGAQPIYQPRTIAANAITNREISPNSVSEESLTFSIADIGGTTVYYGPTQPSGPPLIGDLWVQVTDPGPPAQHQTLRWNGTAWQLLADQKVTQALLDAANAQSTADGAASKAASALVDASNAASAASTAQTTANAKNKSFSQTTAPTTTQGLTVGDEWIDTDDGSKRYYWNGTAWTTTPIGAAAISATSRQLGSVTTYRQATAPTGTLIIGDLWIDSDDNSLYQYTATGWVASQDTGIQQALTNAATAQTAATTAQTSANAKTTTFYQISQPATTGRVVGDMWVDTDDGNKIYTWNGTAWTATLFSAQALNVTARQLGAITIYRQISQPVSAIAGDYWLDSDDGNKPYLYDGTTWTIVQDQQVITALNNAATAQATADSKVRIFPQASPPTGLTAADEGDEWMDTDDSNKIYIWDNTGTIQRTNYLLNPSFESDAAGTLTAPTNWTISFGGTTGTRTVTIVASGATYGTKVARIAGATLSTLNTAYIGFSQVIPVAPGDIVNIIAFNVAYTVVSASQRPEFLVEWLNASNTVISSLTDTSQATMGTAGTRATASYDTTAAPASTATARITIRRRGTLTTGGTNVANADLSVDAMMVEKNRPTNAPTTYFDGSTGGEARWNTPAAAPYSSTSTTWQESTAGAYAWQPRLIRNNAIQPQSLVASNVVATGTVSAALLEAILVLASVVIAGDPAGNHARLESTGLRFYRTVFEGLVESGRFGFGPGDFTGGGSDVNGNLAWTIDDVGQGNFSNANITGDPLIMGEAFSSWLGRASGGGNGSGGVYGAEHWYGFDAAGIIGSITGEAGLIEMSVEVSAERQYLLCMETAYLRTDPLGEMILRIRDGGLNAPSGTSPQIHFRRFSHGVANYDQHVFTPGMWVPSYTGTHRLLMTAERSPGAPGTVAITQGNGGPAGPTIYCLDLGPAKQILATMNRGAGGTPPPVRQYWVELQPDSWATYKGDGTARTDIPNDVVQGYDSVNGDCWGKWLFTLPSIVGTVDKVEFDIQTNYTANPSGASVNWNITSSTGATQSKLRTDFTPSDLYPRLGKKTEEFPTDWRVQFKNTPTTGARAVGVTAGPAGGSSSNFYARFAANSARLRVWFTQ